MVPPRSRRASGRPRQLLLTAAMVKLDYGHDGPSPHEATINYTLSDCGTHYTITPRCYFDKGFARASVKVDAESWPHVRQAPRVRSPTRT